MLPFSPYVKMIPAYIFFQFQGFSEISCDPNPASGTRGPDGGYPPVTRRISVTSRMGFVNFVKHKILTNFVCRRG